MKLYSENKEYKLYQGIMQDMETILKPNSIDSIITDPPYELNFMGKNWDNSGVAFDSNAWKHCYNVLKPGGYLLAFSASRCYHRVCCAIEDAGFEIKDSIIWVYCNGRPAGKELDKLIKEPEIAKNFEGWNYTLKPSYEVIIMAKKPLEGTLSDNIIKYNVGGINIDECRVGESGGTRKINYQKNRDDHGIYQRGLNGGGVEIIDKGKFPPNIIIEDGIQPINNLPEENIEMFYHPKASNKDRNEGLLNKNTHKTIKPTELMQYLVRLVSPKGSTILDCFMGSGSTGKAIMYENLERDSNYKFIGIEMNEEYINIAKQRIDYALKSPIQMSLFNINNN